MKSPFLHCSCRTESGLFQTICGSIAMAMLLVALPVGASSHREAPAILGSPQVDGTDFYMFRSYEPGREGFVTLIANYNPLQDPYGGPNYFPLDANAVYDIHITNNGDVEEDLTFRFRFVQGTNPNSGGSPFISLPIGGVDVPIPLVAVGPAGTGIGVRNLNLQRRFTLEVLRGNVDNPTERSFAVNRGNGGNIFSSPMDNFGNKTYPNGYENYARLFVRDIGIPGCGDGRVFAGQRKESFAVNLGEVFDLVNLNPIGAPDSERSDTEDKNITSLILEVPTDCLTGNSSMIGGWTTARLPRTRSLEESPTFDRPSEHTGDLVQVSRLANPLVNEVAIGLPDKNLFNASHPRDDGTNFLTYVTNPTLPTILQALFGVDAPTNFPRNDLVAVFLTGLPGLNDDGSVGEIMRLNTAIDPTPRDQQDFLGVAGGDAAGYPNGRRPGDDTVDISLRAMMGVLCHLGIGVCEADDAPAGLLPYNDGAAQNALQFDNRFPYLASPVPGSPNDTP